MVLVITHVANVYIALAAESVADGLSSFDFTHYDNTVDCISFMLKTY